VTPGGCNQVRAVIDADECFCRIAGSRPAIAMATTRSRRSPTRRYAFATISLAG
jgi:hypothetical protein